MKFNLTDKDCHAIFIQITEVFELEGYDNLVGTRLNNQFTVIDRFIPIGSKGIFFCEGTKLSPAFLIQNNLYRNSELNKDPNKIGKFDKNGHVKPIRFKKYQTEGFFAPLSSLEYLNPKIEDFFENELRFNQIHILGKTYLICKKYKSPKSNSVNCLQINFQNGYREGFLDCMRGNEYRFK